MYSKEEIEVHIDHLSEIIKNVELTKERSRKTMEDCDKLIEEINEYIKDLRKETE